MAEIKPEYKVICENNVFGIVGKEETTNQRVEIKSISRDEIFVAELAALLNKNKVSLLHAKSVVRDKIYETLPE